MHFSPSTIAALVIAASFAAGLNVYATVLTLGVLARLHWAVLPGGLEMLGDWWVIGASGALFAAEFIADKIPGFDMVWNALHTFVRIPVAALLAYGATTHLSPQMQLLAVAVGSGIALAAHGSKTAVRAAVTPSPEPVSNIALSTTRRCRGSGAELAGDGAPVGERVDCAGCGGGGDLCGALGGEGVPADVWARGAATWRSGRRRRVLDGISRAASLFAICRMQACIQV